MIGEKKVSVTEEKKTTTFKPEVLAVIERRIDEESTIEEETKEEQVPTESVPVTSSTAAPVIVANKTDKAEAKLKEAVRKMMGSFSLWRHKVVSTQFLKDLEEKQKYKKTKGSKKSETDSQEPITV